MDILDKSLKLVAVMGKEAFTEWRIRSPSHRPEEGIDNMLVLLDAIGEEEFRQMTHQKYLGATTTALVLNTQSVKKTIAGRPRGGVERRAARLTTAPNFQHRPIERVLKGEEGADREGGLMPVPRARKLQTRPIWSDAEKRALSNWLEVDEREQLEGKLMGAPSVADRAKEALAEVLASRNAPGITKMVRQIRAARANKRNEQAAAEVVEGVADAPLPLRKRPESAKKNMVESGEPVSVPSSRRPPTPARPSRVRNLPNNAVFGEPWNKEQELALTNWFDTFVANTNSGGPIVLTQLAARAQRELAEALPGRSVRAIEAKLRNLRRGLIAKQPAKMNIGEKVQWSLVQKALLVRWMERNAAGERTKNSTTSIPLAQRAKDDLGDEFHDRSVMAVAKAIMKINSFDTQAQRDEWVKKDGL